MSTPTPEQIRIVNTNLERMIAFNNHVYSFGHTKIEVAFKLLSRTDVSDQGKLFHTEIFKHEEYKRLIDEALHGVDRAVWQEILASQFQVTHWVSNQQFKIKGGPNNPPIDWVKGFYAKHPAYRETWI